MGKRVSKSKDKDRYLAMIKRSNGNWKGKRYYSSDDHKITVCEMAKEIARLREITKEGPAVFDKLSVVLYSSSFLYYHAKRMYDSKEEAYEAYRRDVTDYINGAESPSVYSDNTSNNWLSYITGMRGEWMIHPENVHPEMLHNILYFFAGNFLLEGLTEEYELGKKAILKTVSDVVNNVTSVLTITPSYRIIASSYLMADDLGIVLDSFSIPWFRMFNGKFEIYAGIEKDLAEWLIVEFFKEKALNFKIDVLFKRGYADCKSYMEDRDFIKIKGALNYLGYKIYNDCFNRVAVISPRVPSYMRKKLQIKQEA